MRRIFVLLSCSLLLTTCKMVGSTSHQDSHVKMETEIIPESPDEESDQPSPEEIEAEKNARLTFLDTCQSDVWDEGIASFLKAIEIKSQGECESTYDAILSSRRLSLKKSPSDISPIIHFPSLKSLEIESCDAVTGSLKFEVLGELRRLESLQISGCPITDISWVSSLKNLTTLSMTENKIKDVSSIGKIKTIKYLRLNNNEIENADAIVSNLDLQEIDLSSNQLKTMPDFLQLSDPSKIYLQSNKITEVKRLAGVAASEIDISHNLVDDVNPIFKKRVRFTSFNRIVLHIGCNPLKVAIDRSLPEIHKWAISEDGRDCHGQE